MCDVTDANGTNVYKSVNITVTAPVSLSVSLNSGTYDAKTTTHYGVSVSGGTSPYTYYWTFDGSYYSNASYLNLYGKYGTHTITCTVTDKNGATGTATATVILKDL